MPSGVQLPSSISNIPGVGGLNLPGLGGISLPGGLGNLDPSTLNLILLMLGTAAGAFSTPSSSNTKTNGTTGATSTPNLDSAGQSLEPFITEAARNLVNGGFNPTSYISSGVNNINRNSELQKQAIDSIMAARGLSTSPVSATAAVKADQNRLNQISDLENNAPIIANQIAQQNLATANSAFNSLPRGVTSNGTSTGTSDTSASQGGGLGSALGGLGSILAWLAASGAGQNKNSGPLTSKNPTSDTTTQTSNPSQTNTQNPSQNVTIYIDTKTGQVTTTPGPSTVPVTPPPVGLPPSEYTPPDVQPPDFPQPPTQTGADSTITYPTDNGSTQDQNPYGDLPVSTPPSTGLPPGVQDTDVTSTFMPMSQVRQAAITNLNGAANFEKPVSNIYSTGVRVTPPVTSTTPRIGNAPRGGTPTVQQTAANNIMTANPFAPGPGNPTSVQDAVDNYGFTQDNGNIYGTLNGTPTSVAVAPQYAKSQSMADMLAAFQKSAANPIQPSSPSVNPNQINPGTLSKVLAGLF